jgi:hypothetical protein
MEREVLEGKLLIRLHWDLSKPFKDEKGKSLALGGKEQFSQFQMHLKADSINPIPWPELWKAFA